MYNQKDILTALQNGEDPKVIANAFADALNAAIKEKAEADERAAKAAAATNKKVADMEAIVNALLDFMEEFYPEIYDKEMRTAIDAHGLIKAMDEARDEIVKMQPMFNDLQKLIQELEAEHPEHKPRHTAKPVDPIEAFLKSNGLKM